VEALPEAIQQQVREGKIPAQVAFEVSGAVARQSLEDCQRMAAIFAQHRCDTRETEDTSAVPHFASSPELERSGCHGKQ
jgi:hypothetical protein